MKKLLLLFVSTLLALGVQAQEKQFRAALNAGREQSNYYVIVDPKGKGMKLKKLQEYANSQGYLVGKLTYAQGKDDAVTSFPFLPKEEFPQYIYENLRSDSRDYSDLGNKGMAYCYLPDDEMKVYFWRCDQALWSGQVVNGKITGFGSGFVQVKNNAVVYFKGEFDNGLPVGEVKYKWYSIKSPGQFKKSSITELATTTGRMSDGLASFLDNGRFGFMNSQGLAVLPPVYKKVIAEFANGNATVVQYDKARKANTEVIIDRTGKVIDFTDNQKKIFAQQAAAKAEAERKALIAAREKEISDSLEAVKRAEQAKIAEQKRIEAEKKKAEEAKALVAAKQNCEGRRIRWHETIAYDTSGGGLGGLLTKAVGLGSTKYNVEYTAIVETVIAGSSVKAIITNAKIIDPNWASANYFKYKSYAREDAQKNIGQTRVKTFEEFDLVK